MIKADNIIKIPKYIDKYKKLLDKENDIVKQLKYKRLLREHEYNLKRVYIQLANIDIGIYKDADSYKNIFVDKYINGLTVDQIGEKYIMSGSTVYRKLNKAKQLFENNKYRN